MNRVFLLLLLSSVIGLQRIQIDETTRDEHVTEHTDEDFHEEHGDEHDMEGEHHINEEDTHDFEHGDESHMHTDNEEEVSEHGNEEDTHDHTITESDIENVVNSVRHNVEGTIDVRHPLMKSNDPFSFAYFYRLMQLGHFICYFYNIREGLIEFDDAGNYTAKNNRESQNVVKAQEIVKVIRHHHEEIRVELTEFFLNVENIQISVEELLSFLALENLFKTYLHKAEEAREYEIIEEVADNLQKIVYKFLGSMQLFFKSLSETYDMNKLLKNFASPLAVNIQMANTGDKLEKLEQGKTIIDAIVGMQGHIVKNMDHLKKGVESFKLIRHQIIDEIKMLDSTYRASHGRDGNANIIIT